MREKRFPVAAELAVAPDAAQHVFIGHPARLRRAGEPFRSAACLSMWLSSTWRLASACKWHRAGMAKRS